MESYFENIVEIMYVELIAKDKGFAILNLVNKFSNFPIFYHLCFVIFQF